MSSEYQVDIKSFTEFLKELLIPQIDQAAKTWLLQKLELLGSEPSSRDLFLIFSAIPRFIGKKPLELTQSDEARGHQLRSGLNLKGWSVPQTARVLTLCAYHFDDAGSYLKLLDQLYSTAEVSELVALYSALPVLPYPSKLMKRASEGVRTNMTVVFDAVVLNNPYPCDYLDEAAWNQMVLKALFMERPLYQIYGLEQRANLQLSKMISNFAHERWAAGRPTSPEMWRPIGKYGPENVVNDLEHLAKMDDPDQQAAAVLTAQNLGSLDGKSFLEKHTEIVDNVMQNHISWADIGARWWQQKQ